MKVQVLIIGNKNNPKQATKPWRALLRLPPTPAQLALLCGTRKYLAINPQTIDVKVDMAAVAAQSNQNGLRFNAKLRLRWHCWREERRIEVLLARNQNIKNCVEKLNALYEKNNLAQTVPSPTELKQAQYLLQHYSNDCSEEIFFTHIAQQLPPLVSARYQQSITRVGERCCFGSPGQRLWRWLGLESQATTEKRTAFKTRLQAGSPVPLNQRPKESEAEEMPLVITSPLPENTTTQGQLVSQTAKKTLPSQKISFIQLVRKAIFSPQHRPWLNKAAQFFSPTSLLDHYLDLGWMRRLGQAAQQALQQIATPQQNSALLDYTNIIESTPLSSPQKSRYHLHAQLMLTLSENSCLPPTFELAEWHYQQVHHRLAQLQLHSNKPAILQQNQNHRRYIIWHLIAILALLGPFKDGPKEIELLYTECSLLKTHYLRIFYQGPRGLAALDSNNIQRHEDQFTTETKPPEFATFAKDIQLHLMLKWFLEKNNLFTSPSALPQQEGPSTQQKFIFQQMLKLNKNLLALLLENDGTAFRAIFQGLPFDAKNLETRIEILNIFYEPQGKPIKLSKDFINKARQLQENTTTHFKRIQQLSKIKDNNTVAAEQIVCLYGQVTSKDDVPLLLSTFLKCGHLNIVYAQLIGDIYTACLYLQLPYCSILDKFIQFDEKKCLARLWEGVADLSTKVLLLQVLPNCLFGMFKNDFINMISLVRLVYTECGKEILHNENLSLIKTLKQALDSLRRFQPYETVKKQVEQAIAEYKKTTNQDKFSFKDSKVTHFKLSIETQPLMCNDFSRNMPETKEQNQSSQEKRKTVPVLNDPNPFS